MDHLLVARALSLTAVAGALAFAGGCSLARAAVFPAPKPAREPVSSEAELVKIPLGSTHAVAFHMKPAPHAPTIAWFHGNGMQIADVIPVAERLHREGLGVFAIEYPGYGLAPGSPSETSLYETADAALVYLRDRLDTPTRRTVLLGQSIGTGVAVEMAQRGFGARLILISPFTSLREVVAKLVPVLPVEWLVRDRFESEAKASAIRMPVLIVHGERDELVPIAMGKSLASQFPDARLEIVPSAGHNDLFSVHGTVVMPLVGNFANEVTSSKDDEKGSGLSPALAPAQ